MRASRSSRATAILAVGAAIILALAIPAAAVAAPVLADSCPESGWTGGAYGFYSSAPAFAQSFTAIGGTLDSASFYVHKDTNGVGSVYAQLYALTGTYGTNSVPSGSPLATSTAIPVAAISSGYHLVTFAFDNTVSLTAGTKYAIVIRYVGDSAFVGAVGLFMGSTAHPGNLAFWVPSGSYWYPDTPRDLIFYVYETPPPPAPVSTPASSSWSLALLAVGALGLMVVLGRKHAAA